MNLIYYFVMSGIILLLLKQLCQTIKGKKDKAPDYRPYSGLGPTKGDFIFEDEKVILKTELDRIEFTAENIIEVNAYQIDLYIHDCVMIDIHLESGATVRMAEGGAEYEKLVFEFFQNLPGYEFDWFFKVTSSAFDENFTQVYKKEEDRVSRN